MRHRAKFPFGKSETKRNKADKKTGNCGAGEEPRSGVQALERGVRACVCACAGVREQARGSGETERGMRASTCRVGARRGLPRSPAAALGFKRGRRAAHGTRLLRGNGRKVAESVRASAAGGQASDPYGVSDRNLPRFPRGRLFSFPSPPTSISLSLSLRRRRLRRRRRLVAPY